MLFLKSLIFKTGPTAMIYDLCGELSFIPQWKSVLDLIYFFNFSLVVI